MKKSFKKSVLVLGVAITLLATSVITDPIKTYANTVYTTTSSLKVTKTLNLRAKPSTNGKVISYIPQGTSIKYTGSQSGSWLQVQYQNKTGYISQNYVKDTNPTSLVKNTNNAVVTNVFNKGNKLLGTPYKFGAKTGTTKNFDCSSFVQYLYAQNNINLPRTSQEQSKIGVKIPKSQLQKGDLVFFTRPDSGKEVGHVAIYAGDGKLLHTYGKPGVTYSNLNSSVWSSRYVTARRITSVSYD